MNAPAASRGNALRGLGIAVATLAICGSGYLAFGLPSSAQEPAGDDGGAAERGDGLTDGRAAVEAVRDASVAPAEASEAATAEEEAGVAPSVPMNQWVGVDADEANVLTPFDLLLPSRIPEGFSDEVSIALRMWDLTGDGEGDLHNVVVTITPEAGPRDEAGHGNVQISLGSAPDGLPPMLAEQPTIDIGRGVEARGASLGGASAVAWVEGDVLVQLSGELDEAALLELTGGLRWQDPGR